jgi:hypothetical protein
MNKLSYSSSASDVCSWLLVLLDTTSFIFSAKLALANAGAWPLFRWLGGWCWCWCWCWCSPSESDHQLVGGDHLDYLEKKGLPMDDDQQPGEYGAQVAH